MNRLIALCYFVLSLYGCDVGGSTYVHRTHVDGSDTLNSRVVARPGVTRFECLRSASGQCHYTLFPRDCASTSATAPGSPAASTGGRSDNCVSEPVVHFAVANGDSREVVRLQRFRLCVSSEDGTPGPDCKVTEAMASR